MTDALKKRKEIKAKKPEFLTQDYHKKKRISQRWRRPKGLQSKVRLNKRGYRRAVSSGWRSPKAARGLSPEGLEPVRVENLAQLEALDAKTQGAMVSRRVSMRTKKALYDAAAEKNITVLNRDVKVFAERFESKMAERAARKQQLAKKEKEREAKEKADAEAEEKAAKDAEKQAAEKKAAEKESAQEAKAESKPAEKKESKSAESEKKEKATTESKPAAAQKKADDSKKDDGASKKEGSK